MDCCADRRRTARNVGRRASHAACPPWRTALPSRPCNRRSDRAPAIQIGPRSTPEGPQERDGEQTYEQCYAQHLDRYYDEVIGQLGQPAALLIFGPGEAKLQLKARLSQSTAMTEQLVGIETTDKMTDPQIVAKVKDHYGIERREDAVPPAHTSKPH